MVAEKIRRSMSARGTSMNYSQLAEQKLTPSVVVISIIAGSAGLMFGYDIGVSGGVTAMESFLMEFFPSVIKKMVNAKQDDQYCTFDSPLVTAFTSSLYIAGLVSSLLAGRVTSMIGRKGTLVISGIVFLLGTVLCAFAFHVAMLILGRFFVGFGIGFANQAAPVYLSEMAPPRWRGAMSSAFQFFICLGSVLASFVNFGANKISQGWRLALGFAGLLAIMMTAGTLYIPDTPSSLIQRGKVSEARDSLMRIRGMGWDSEAELNELIRGNEAARAMSEEPYRKLLRRRFRPHLVLIVAIPSFQQLTGVSMVAFYAPVLMRSMGLNSDGALLVAILLGVVNLGSALVSTYMVDRVGRKLLFLEGGAQIIFSQVFIACTLAIQAQQEETSSRSSALVVLLLMCFISAAFGWSWGPLTWLVPSEILPIDLRPVGNGISIACNFLVTFILAQLSLTMLCHFKYGLFLLYGFLTLIMTAFVALFVPETKGIPLDCMDNIWRQHWYWRRYVPAPPSSLI